MGSKGLIGLKYVPVFLTDSLGELMHMSLDNSKLISQRGFLSCFHTLSLRRANTDIVY